MFTGEAVWRKSICEIGVWGQLGGYRHSVLTDPKGQLGQSQWDGDRKGYQAVTQNVQDLELSPLWGVRAKSRLDPGFWFSDWCIHCEEQNQHNPRMGGK